MTRIGRLKAAIAALTVTGATVAAMSIAASPAVAFSSGGLVLDITVQAPGQIIASGGAVLVPVGYVCTGSFAQLSVSINEATEAGIAFGTGFADAPVCDGDQHNVQIDVPANGQAYKPGAAAAFGTLSGCLNFCAQQTDNRTTFFVQ